MSARDTGVFNRIKIDIHDQWFLNFPNDAFDTAEFGCIVSLTAILHLLQRKESVVLIVA